MLTCEKCNKIYADTYQKCPHCGGRKVVIPAIVSIAILVIVILALAVHDPASQPISSQAAGNDSDVVRFDPNDAVHKAQFDRLEAGAGACMQRAIHGLLLQGIRSRETLLGFAETNCGSPFKRFLVSFKVPDKAADELIHQDAENVLEVELK